MSPDKARLAALPGVVDWLACTQPRQPRRVQTRGYFRPRPLQIQECHALRHVEAVGNLLPAASFFWRLVLSLKPVADSVAAGSAPSMFPGKHGGDMTIASDLNVYITSLAPGAFCDDCLKRALGPTGDAAPWTAR